jgi:hypothetical protein
MQNLTRVSTPQGFNVAQPLQSTQDSESVLSVLPATANSLGVVQPDNTTVHINAEGVMSATGSGGTVESVTASAPVASSGGINPNISIALGTSLAPGAVQADGTTVTITAGVLSVIQPSPILTFSGTVPNANVVTLFSAPLLLIDPPGAGNLIRVLAATIENLNGGVLYTLGGGIGFFYGGDTPPVNNATSLYTAAALTGFTASNILVPSNGGATATVLSAKAVNAGLYLGVETQNFAVGTGTLKVVVTYVIQSGF